MATHLLTPSPSPPPIEPIPTLSVQINTATKQQHIHLNRLIMRRLPLALPPYASSPELYARGLAVFARVYFAFEAAWQEMISSAVNKAERGSHDNQVLQFLSTLRPHGLERTARLENDIKFISRRTGVDVESTLETKQQDMLDVITSSISENPHLLLAYGWVLYMAIFSGGRWIRQQLSAAGSEFWTDEQDLTQLEKHDIESSEMPGFSFLSFDSENDGEDIKASFKARMAEAECLLTQQERQDVVDAAQELFDDCITLVGMLDREIGQQNFKKKKTSSVIFFLVGVLLFVFGLTKFRYGQWRFSICTTHGLLGK